MSLTALSELAKYLDFVNAPDGAGGFIRTLVVSGINVQIVNSTGDTSEINGAGNLIIGYNEPAVPSGLRTGSHNIIYGKNNGYTQYAGVVGGEQNNIQSPFSSIIGGRENRTTINNGEGGIIIGAQNSETAGTYAVIVGGNTHIADWSNNGSVIVGGEGNSGNGVNSVIVGGKSNQIEVVNSVIVGGAGNRIMHDEATESVIVGGESNIIDVSAPYSVIGGGLERAVSGIHDFRAGTILEDQ